MWDTKDGIQLWGGIECTVNRIGDRHFDQFVKSGHLDRPEDLDLVAELGVRTLRYPVLWERTAPHHPEQRDWSFSDERLDRLRRLGVDPIVGLTHHGSGPTYTHLLDDEGFASGLADHARAVAERYPWVEAYTPVNEPLTTARFSGMYGHWYPHATDPKSFSRALINQVKAVALSMNAIREVVPHARLVQTEDLGKTHSTGALAYQAEYENVRRWISWDLLCGMVDRDHPLWDGFLHDGVSEAELDWFLANPCPPDVVGINYYLTSERFLDHRLDRYPAHVHGSNGRDRYADVEAVRVLAGGIDGASTLIREAWERYGLPIAITECHLGCTREEQVRWLFHVWNQAEQVRTSGVDVRAVTVWSMFGAYDWCSLLTQDENRYEPGVFDLRAPEPRPTALAEAVRTLARGEGPHHPIYEDDGWWDRPVRLLYEPRVVRGTNPTVSEKGSRGRRSPLLIVGSEGPLATAFANLCELRGLDFRMVSSFEVSDALERERPWAVVGTVDGDVAEACRLRKVRLLAFSSSDVFESEKDGPYRESDATNPNHPLVEIERNILNRCPDALIVRTGPIIGPGGDERFVRDLVDALRAERPFEADDAETRSYAFAPDLVHTALDLLIDGMTGVLHLAHEEAFTEAELGRRIAQLTDLDADLVRDVARGPRKNRALASERIWAMPSLEAGLMRYSHDLRRVGERVDPVSYLL